VESEGGSGGELWPHGAERHGRGAWRPTQCGRAAATRKRRRQVAHGGGRERERRERAGEVGQWAGPQNGSHLSAKEGGREREWQVGPAAIQIKFEIIQICYNLV
jgi:hypothetical protein